MKTVKRWFLSPTLALAFGAMCLGFAVITWPARAELTSGAYQTPPGATVTEVGIQGPGESREVPYFATVVFDLGGSQPSLSSIITNAVLEGGEPFSLTVHSSSGYKLNDGSYRFMGDYLPDTQYMFDWKFTASTNAEIVWAGITGWSGGHIWYVTITNISLVPVPWLNISRVSPASASVQLWWSTNFADYIPEFATALPTLDWSSVTNPVTGSDDRLSVTLDADESHRFYRLRKP